jgi:hypothetical protein
VKPPYSVSNPPPAIADTPKVEKLRRLRIGDLQKLLRFRYGPTLPDDDAGRDDLRELLLPVSLGREAEHKMKHIVEVWAPWMPATEARQLIDDISRTPAYLRKSNAQEIGNRQNVTYHTRQTLGLRTIAPCDMTPDQLTEWRKAKKRARAERRRRKAGQKPRQAYLANSLSRLKPWEAKDISRAKWYRQRETSPYPIKLLNSRHTLVSPTKLKRCKAAIEQKARTTSGDGTGLGHCPEK